MTLLPSFSANEIVTHRQPGNASTLRGIGHNGASVGSPAYDAPPSPFDASIRVLSPRQWWYVAPVAGSAPGTVAEGPWTLPRLQSAIDHGTIESTRLVWTPGMPAWEPAGHQDEFAFGFAPPPLPAA